MMNLKCISLNVRGINKAVKRRNVFRWLHNGKYDVNCLQETYSDKAMDNVWSAEWGGDIFYSHGSRHSRAVTILIPLILKAEYISISGDKNGESLLLILQYKIKSFFCSQRLKSSGRFLYSANE